MTTHSITVPDGWEVHTANGPYEETMFQFRFETTGSTELSVRLVGRSSADYDAVYTTTVVVDDGEEHAVDGGEYTSEAAAMETTEELLHSLQRSIRADGRTLDELDVETLAAMVGRYRFGVLGYRLRGLLGTFLNSRDTG